MPASEQDGDVAYDKESYNNPASERRSDVDAARRMTYHAEAAWFDETGTTYPAPLNDRRLTVDDLAVADEMTNQNTDEEFFYQD